MATQATRVKRTGAHDSNPIHVTAELDEIRVARERDSVTFHEVARAWFGATDPGPHELQERFRREFHATLSAFEESRGRIESAYYCRHLRVAAALTDIDWAAGSAAGKRATHGRDRGLVARALHRVAHLDRASASAIHVEPLLGHPEHWQSKELLFGCLDLHYRALEFLKPQHRKICMRRIFAIITSLLGTLDQRAAIYPKPGDERVRLEPHEWLCLNAELEETKAYFRQHATRRAQLNYFLGMLGGVSVLLAVFGVAVACGASWSEPVLLTLVAGGVGAVVSVMMRVTRGNLLLDGEAGTLITALLGAFRPLTGGVFGLVTYVLLRGQLLTLTQHIPAGLAGTFYYTGLAFVAGFTERIAQIVPEAAGTAGAGSDSSSRINARMVGSLEPTAPAAPGPKTRAES